MFVNVSGGRTEFFITQTKPCYLLAVSMLSVFIMDSPPVFSPLAEETTVDKVLWFVQTNYFLKQKKNSAIKLYSCIDCT